VSAAPWAAHFGLARTPFGKSIAARDLFPRQAHAEAIARISFCVVECALGVVTGDVGAGKTVALRAAVAGLDPTRHQVITSPTRPSAPGACMSRSSGRWAPSPATSKPS
jgi:type II secretory pathway predicted ATPase ExeA